MLNRKNKKGFTLAELLIVVAIIAVLVAIAVPLFVGALNDADKRVQEANIRAVRGAAVEKILMNNDTGKDYQTVTTKGDAIYWQITAYVSAGGDIHDMEIKPLTSATAGPGGTTGKAEKLKEEVKDKAQVGEYKVELDISELTASKVS